MRKPISFHPFLFPLFPLISLYVENRALVAPVEVILPFIVALALAVTLVLGARLFSRDTARSGIIITTFLLLFFSYGHIHFVLENMWIGRWQVGQHLYLLPLFAVLFTVLVRSIVRLRRPEVVVHVLNAVTLGAVCVTIVGVIPRELHRVAVTQRLRSELNATALPPPPPPKAGDLRPDIYYLILDRYAAPGALREILHYDDSGFVGALQDRGFYVAPDSRANYVGTFVSLASSLNMRHLSDLSPGLRGAISQRSVIYDMLQRHDVGRYLKQQGYEYIHLGNWWRPTRTNIQADVNVNSDAFEWMEFPNLAIRTTMLKAFTTQSAWEEEGRRKRARLGRMFGAIRQAAADVHRPKFVFAHFTMPHPPYIYGPDGHSLSWSERVEHTPLELCLWQVTYINREMTRLIDDIQAPGHRPAVIVLQADEGPCEDDGHTGGFIYINRDGTLSRHPDAARFLKLRVWILNAIYLPDGNHHELYPTISPVNTFRVIFNRYFHTNYPLLPDRTYLSPDAERPCDFRDITSLVR